MKSSIMKKVLAICLVAAISTITIGCGGKTNSENEAPQETINIDDTKQELQFFYGNGESVDSTEAPENSNADSKAETNAGDDKPATETAATETEIVTEIATQYVNATDEAGQDVTDAQGVVQTEVQTEIVTEIVTVPASTEEQKPTESEYTPSYDTCKAYWLDMSQMGDYNFNGEFLVLEFEINENIPDGSYPITITKTDIGSWDLLTRVPECINGEVTVGDAEPAEQSKATTGAFALKVKNASGNCGDTVKVAIDLSNNPGFCGFVIDIQYDAAALTIADSYGGADFDAAIKIVE